MILGAIIASVSLLFLAAAFIPQARQNPPDPSQVDLAEPDDERRRAAKGLLDAIPEIQQIKTAAQQHGWNITFYDLDRCVFVSKQSNTLVMTRWGDPNTPVLYAEADQLKNGCHSTITVHLLDNTDGNPPDEHVRILQQFFADHATEPLHANRR
ncbi:hypothetical protein AOT93_05495 [Mycobacteroides sp. H110]|nr:hypothetical protein AOT91_23145 [Mycobacteroides sp. H092]KRQ23481.1 hypothetical protein AOT87_12405 [Mycobacteroides sp. H003]KRQ40290.1 hypothetical protein AOT92_15035 [Mycobacteroides sp. H101]KRQ47397.1 hypothetical protein AOT88_15885 [Mycobacteroides sp. H063]KRQ57738.1 hypothetical protein AOT90_25795 [Mycobacteroides sp. H079]KRQ77607.1 hypothetical protein AOT95_22210 [Mycobacteroides sp. HXXIII]KRQ84360.1 hypothetical protein AOT93_05495 [Mycobacteroides sp. H110]